MVPEALKMPWTDKNVTVVYGNFFSGDFEYNLIKSEEAQRWK